MEEELKKVLVDIQKALNNKATAGDIQVVDLGIKTVVDALLHEHALSKLMNIANNNKNYLPLEDEEGDEDE